MDRVYDNSAALKDTDRGQTLFEIEEKWGLFISSCVW